MFIEARSVHWGIVSRLVYHLSSDNEVSQGAEAAVSQMGLLKIDRSYCNGDSLSLGHNRTG
jgi:hypothetical protein